MGFRRPSSFSRDRKRSWSIRSRSSGSLAGSRFLAPFLESVAGGDLLRFGEGERDGGDLFLGFDGPGEYDSPGGGVGNRTAEESIAVAMVVSTTFFRCLQLVTVNCWEKL